MDIKIIKEDLQKLGEIDHVENYESVETYESEIALFFIDYIYEAVEFLRDGCTDEELYLVSNTFPEVVEETYATDLIEVVRERLARITPETFDPQNFKSAKMRECVDYNEFIRHIEKQLKDAEVYLD